MDPCNLPAEQVLGSPLCVATHCGGVVFVCGMDVPSHWTMPLRDESSHTLVVDAGALDDRRTDDIIQMARTGLINFRRLVIYNWMNGAVGATLRMLCVMPMEKFVVIPSDILSRYKMDAIIGRARQKMRGISATTVARDSHTVAVRINWGTAS